DAVIRGPFRPAFDPAIGNDLAPLEIDDRQVGIVAFGNAPLTGDAEDALRAMARQVDETLDREAPLVDMIEHDRNQRLDAGHARWRRRIGPRLLIAPVRGGIGAPHIDDAAPAPLPQCPSL